MTRRRRLHALLPLLKQRTDTSFLEKYQKQMESWREKMAALQDEKRDPIAPEYLWSRCWTNWPPTTPS